MEADIAMAGEGGIFDPSLWTWRRRTRWLVRHTRFDPKPMDPEEEKPISGEGGIFESQPMEEDNPVAGEAYAIWTSRLPGIACIPWRQHC